MMEKALSVFICVLINSLIIPSAASSAPPPALDNGWLTGLNPFIMALRDINCVEDKTECAFTGLALHSPKNIACQKDSEAIYVAPTRTFYLGELGTRPAIPVDFHITSLANPMLSRLMVGILYFDDDSATQLCSHNNFYTPNFLYNITLANDYHHVKYEDLLDAAKLLAGADEIERNIHNTEDTRGFHLSTNGKDIARNRWQGAKYAVSKNNTDDKNRFRYGRFTPRISEQNLGWRDAISFIFGTNINSIIYLNINSTPSGADIIINNRKFEKTTDVKIALISRDISQISVNIGGRVVHLNQCEVSRLENTVTARCSRQQGQ
ncbi:hypothetical protein [Novosphingobium kaempferiae]|uniref:hypothetical protein n=1 Tax=Novosphingobium kaempferiae TaxID=2896849 RepID=UPI001E387EB4|nr:hypothetical protein [Novosphingobium kaempferiae]